MKPADINFGQSLYHSQTRSLVDVLQDGSKAGFGNVSITGSTSPSPNTLPLSQKAVTADGAESARPSLVSSHHCQNGNCLERTLVSRQDWDLARMGRLALANGNLIDAMLYFQKHFDEAKRSGSPELIAEAATDLAYISSMSGSSEKAGRLYQLALQAWSKARSESAVKSPRVMSAFVLFLFDYAEYQTVRSDFIVAAKARRRLHELAKRFSPFTIYSALAKRLRERGQHREARMVLDLARAQPIKREQAAYNQQILSNVRATQEHLVFLPPIDLAKIKKSVREY